MGLEGVSSVEVDKEHSTAVVVFEDTLVTPETMENTLNQSGYTVAQIIYPNSATEEETPGSNTGSQIDLPNQNSESDSGGCFLRDVIL